MITLSSLSLEALGVHKVQSSLSLTAIKRVPKPDKQKKYIATYKLLDVVATLLLDLGYC